MAQADRNRGGSSNGFLKLTVAFCLGVAFAIVVQRVAATKTAPASQPVSHVNQPVANRTDKPWGDLEITSIPFENSEEIFLDRAERLKTPEWVFEPATAAQVQQLLQSIELTDEQKRELQITNLWKEQAGSCTIHPSPELLFSLSSSAREKIYGVLGQCSSNYAQCFPFRFAPKRFEERFANSGLAAETVKLVRNLCYTNEGLMSFCDLGVASAKLKASEFDGLIRVLYAVPTVRLRLRVHPDSNIDQLVAYWGKGGREKRVRPMLESVARLPGGDSVALPYLLPGVARLRLYTFPDVERDAREAREDCFFTALNFFNKYADDRFFDKANSRQTLQNDYTLVSDQPTYGDLVTVINGQGDALHIAVYIADDIVFTKNGVNILQPWVLMRMDDMMSYFPSPEPLRIVIFRKKALTQASVVSH
ncbi:MAG: hypothetical protein ACXWC8_05330 [Limisphaerales bacterium]